MRVNKKTQAYFVNGQFSMEVLTILTWFDDDPNFKKLNLKLPRSNSKSKYISMLLKRHYNKIKIIFNSGSL